MQDFRLKVFDSVARNQSFTKAATELFITQPAVTKHIKALETELDLRLFDRRGNAIILTPPGEVLYKYSAKIFALYQEAIYELGTFKNQLTGTFRLGASTTIAQYLISPLLAKFHAKYPQIQLTLMNGNTEVIENAILDGKIDLGIVEGQKHNPGIRYHDFMEDELVAVVHSKSKFARLDSINVEEIINIPLVLRERGSGTLEVLEMALRDKNIKFGSLNIIMHLGSSESIKSFLEHANCMSFISVKAIQKELQSGELKVIKINNFRILRTLSFIHPQGQPEGLATNFMRFAARQYNQK